MVRVTAKANYAVQVLLALATQPPGALTTAERLADEHALPPKFVQNILAELRARGLVRNTRGHGGGYQLARQPEAITVFDVVGAIDPPRVAIDAAANGSLDEVWRAAHASLCAVLAAVTLADVIAGRVPVAGDFH